MDLELLQRMIPDIAKYLNVEPSTVLFYLGVVMVLANLAGRLIPDDQTGFLGRLRELCKVIGVYASNRVTSGVSVNEAAKVVVAAVAESKKPDEPTEPDEPAPVPPVKIFPGLAERSQSNEDDPASPRM
jgi:hypothetical protein